MHKSDSVTLQSSAAGGSKSPNTVSTVNADIYQQDGDYIKDIEVNDLRNRYTLTKGATQKMVNTPVAPADAPSTAFPIPSVLCRRRWAAARPGGSSCMCWRTLKLTRRA